MLYYNEIKTSQKVAFETYFFEDSWLSLASWSTGSRVLSFLSQKTLLSDANAEDESVAFSVIFEVKECIAKPEKAINA